MFVHYLYNFFPICPTPQIGPTQRPFLGKVAKMKYLKSTNLFNTADTTRITILVPRIIVLSIIITIILIMALLLVLFLLTGFMTIK